MYCTEFFLVPGIVLIFGCVLYQLKQADRFTQRQTFGFCITWGLALLLSVFYCLAGIHTIDAFKALTADQIAAMTFFDEALHNYSCFPHGNVPPSECIVLQVNDPKVLQKLATSFLDSRPFTPGKQSAHDRYLVRLQLRQADDVWFLLGHGTKTDPDTAWVEFKSNFNQGWHFGAYLNPSLFQALKQEFPQLKWWQAGTRPSMNPRKATKK